MNKGELLHANDETLVQGEFHRDWWFVGHAEPNP
jgi:hypothetical protein